MGDQHADTFQSKCQVLQRSAECFIDDWRMRYATEIAIPEIEALMMQPNIVFGLHLSRL